MKFDKLSQFLTFSLVQHTFHLNIDWVSQIWTFSVELLGIHITWKGPGRARSLSASQWANGNRLDFKLTGRQIDSWPCQVIFMFSSFISFTRTIIDFFQISPRLLLDLGDQSMLIKSSKVTMSTSNVKSWLFPRSGKSHGSKMSILHSCKASDDKQLRSRRHSELAN